MDLITTTIRNYIEQNTQDEPALLAQLSKETYQKVLLPNMISGHYQGRILSMFSKIVRPKTILEIGTYTGYSALCLCEGLSYKGVLHTIDIKEELQSLQRKYFNLSPWGNQIYQHLGEAKKIIPDLEITLDLVFIDADKANYCNYFNLILPKMNSGGIIISDNVLWKGKVIEDLSPDDIDTRELLKYNNLLKNDSRVETVILPIRDGLSVTRVI